MGGWPQGHHPVSSVGTPAPPTDGADLPTLSSRPAAVITMDVHGTILEFNDAAERLTGFPRAEAIGSIMSDLLIPGRLRAAHEAGLRRFRETGLAPLLDTRFYMPTLRRDGTEIIVELEVNRITVDGQPAFLGWMREASAAHPVPGELSVHADFHRTLVDQSPIMVFVVDEHGKEAWSSQAAQLLFGPPSGRNMEQLVEELIHPGDAETARVAVARAGADGLDEPIDLRVRSPDGTWRALALLARNLLDHPAVHGTAFYATDVTRARIAEQQRRVEQTRMAALLESLSVGVLLQDEQRRVVLTNAAFVDLFELGLPADGMGGLSARRPGEGFANLYAEPDAALDRVDAIIRRGRPVVGEEVQLVHGRVLERDYTPITMDGATLGHLWVYRDVTAQAEIRHGLEERNRLLSELATLKTEFIAVVSHELRTPLTSINTFATILGDDDAGLSPSEHATAVAAVQRNADHMLALVADLILLARLESGELGLTVTAVDLPALVRGAVEAVRTEAEDSSEPPDVQLTTDLVAGQPLHCDNALVSQVIHTALQVLVDASTAGAEVAVSARPTDDGWRVDVVTSHTDVPTAERLLSTRLPHPGMSDGHRTGALAVMLARAIASRHGGELSMVMTHPGAQITVTLPTTPTA